MCESKSLVLGFVLIFSIPVVAGEANVWIAAADSDGLASTAANWSQGLPTSDSDIVLDGTSQVGLTWDAGVNGLPAEVKSWTQDEGYTGTVTFLTKYPVTGDAFQLFTVSGAMVVNGGTLTHPLSVNLDDNTAKPTIASLRERYTYRLNLKAGSFTLGAGAKIDASGKGHSQRRVTRNVPEIRQAHGGCYEDQSKSLGGCYGNPKYPEDIGTAGNGGTDSLSKCSVGGGAVKLAVDGACVLAGEISVDGTKASGNLSAGAAGSILVEADSVSGEGTGVLHADGISCGNNSYLNGAPGRIAVLTREPVDHSQITLSASGVSSGKYSPCGTVFVKDATMSNGVLYMKNRLNVSSVNATAGRGTFVTAEEGCDWTFDRLVFEGAAQLYVPENTTLSLPNGFASVDASANTVRASGIVGRGGRLELGEGNQKLTGKWYFAPVDEYVFPASVSLEKGACIGFPAYFEQSLGQNLAPATNAVWAIRCTVAGDVTVDATSGFSTDQAGPVQQSGKQFAGVSIGNHGGRQTEQGVTMGSVFDPVLAPVGQSNSYGYMKPGAAMIVRIGGKLDLHGVVSANPVNSQGGGFNLAAGGSINFTVGELTGDGRFEAKGFRNKQCGGRIAVRLTKPRATFDTFTGTFNAQTSSGATLSTPGSVYLETAGDGAYRGTVCLDNRSTSLTALSVPICANGYQADEVAAFKKADLVVRGGAYAQVAVADENNRFQMHSLDMIAPSKLDLNGKTLVVARARIGSVRLSPGTYAATDAALAGYVVDSADGMPGRLEVTGGGLSLVVR